MQFETSRFVTADGVELEADVAVPDEARAAAVLAHPHPAYGGNRHHPLISALFEALPAAGCAVLRFDFREVRSPESAANEVRAELGDVAAAIDLLARRAPGVPLWLVGYSFGAMVGLDVDDSRLAGWVAVAPPLRDGACPAASHDGRPVTLLVPEHDQFCPPTVARHVVRSWTNGAVEEIPMADHFLHGRIAAISARIVEVVAG